MTEPPEAPLPDEWRCPRCGASMEQERRDHERRRELRRQNPSLDPGPPGARSAGRQSAAREWTAAPAPDTDRRAGYHDGPGGHDGSVAG